MYSNSKLFRNNNLRLIPNLVTSQSKNKNLNYISVDRNNDNFYSKKP